MYLQRKGWIRQKQKKIQFHANGCFSIPGYLMKYGFLRTQACDFALYACLACLVFSLPVRWRLQDFMSALLLLVFLLLLVLVLFLFLFLVLLILRRSLTSTARLQWSLLDPNSKPRIKVVPPNCNGPFSTTARKNVRRYAK